MPRVLKHILLLCLLLSLGNTSAWATRGKVDPDLRAALYAAVQDADSFEDRFEAEVWMADMANRLKRFMPDADTRVDLLRRVHAEASRVEVPAELVLAIIQVESWFDRFAISHAGARGLMQIMPFWKDELKRPDDNLFNVQTNLRYGCTILRHYLDREKGDLTKALARYNGSVGRTVYSDKVYKALNRTWFQQ